MEPIQSYEWADRAACRNSNVDFFAEELSEECYELCDACPVKEQCLNQAMIYEHYGFWAGTTERERYAERRVRGIAQPFFDRTINKQLQREIRAQRQEKTVPSTLIQHGTEKGYLLHNKRLTPMCEPCKTAHREYIAEYRRKKKEKEAEKSVSI
jgi:hypothetical protein